jgi:thioredoxin reductase (NADPH)
MAAMRKQAERLGVVIINRDVERVDLSGSPFKLVVDGEEYLARSVIIATGAGARWLGVPGEQKLIGRGVSSCAPCDAPFFRDKKVVVVGGGDSAMEEAGVLVKFASEVTIAHRRGEFRACKMMWERVLGNPKVKVLYSTEVKEVLGQEKVTGVRLVCEGREREMPIDGVFVAIGYDPNTEIFRGQLELDEKGYIKEIRNLKFEIRNEKGEVIGNKYQMMTSRGGVFVAGEAHDWHYRQAITAAGFGCQAALEAIRWLGEAD